MKARRARAVDLGNDALQSVQPNSPRSAHAFNPARARNVHAAHKFSRHDDRVGRQC